MDLVKEDMDMVEAREKDEVDRVLWRRLSRCGDSEHGNAEKRREIWLLRHEITMTERHQFTMAKLGQLRNIF